MAWAPIDASVFAESRRRRITEEMGCFVGNSKRAHLRALCVPGVRGVMQRRATLEVSGVHSRAVRQQHLQHLRRARRRRRRRRRAPARVRAPQQLDTQRIPRRRRRRRRCRCACRWSRPINPRRRRRRRSRDAVTESMGAGVHFVLARSVGSLSQSSRGRTRLLVSLLSLLLLRLLLFCLLLPLPLARPHLRRRTSRHGQAQHVRQQRLETRQLVGLGRHVQRLGACPDPSPTQRVVAGEKRRRTLGLTPLRQRASRGVV